MLRQALGIAVASVLVLMVAETPASATGPVAATCGAELDTNAYLAADLTCAPTQTIYLSGSMTLDLRGHSITNSGSADGNPAAIVSSGDITVRNGRISGWGDGIVAFGDRLALRSVTIADSAYAAIDVPQDFLTVANVDIVGSTLDGNGVGLTVGWYQGSYSVTDSTFRDNGIGIRLGDLHTLSLTRSRFDGNSTGVSCSYSQCSISGTTFSRNGTAVTTRGGTAALGENVFDSNVTAFRTELGADGSVRANSFTRNTTAVDLGALTDATVSGNVFGANGVGIGGSSPSTSGVLLQGNQLLGNGSGILLTDASGARLKGNRAMYNKHAGIRAPGALDLGGNRASGNGSQPQCLGVRCTA